jgi:hypothetical protein
MERGRKPEPPDTKLARGTFQPCRDGQKVQIIAPGDPPMMPDYLTAEAEIVWQEILGRVMAVGIAEPDSALLARYCAMEALARKTLSTGEPIPASVMTALRQYEELLRIAGPKSRVGVKPGGKSANPFARNGRR